MNKKMMIWLARMSTVLLASGFAAETMAQASVQDDTASRLLACDPIEDAAEKMACFDAVVKDIKESAHEPSAEAPATPGAPAEAELKAAASAAVLTIEEQPVATKKTTEPELPVAAPNAETVDEARGMTAVPGEPATDDFGLEDQQSRAASENQKRVEKEKKNQDKQSVQATIVTVSPTIDGRFEVLLDNGQVWRETEGSRIRTPKEGSNVTITSGAFGSFLMKIGNDRRRARVRRTK